MIMLGNKMLKLLKNGSKNILHIDMVLIMMIFIKHGVYLLKVFIIIISIIKVLWNQ